METKMHKILRVIASSINAVTRYAEILSEIGLAFLMIMVFREVVWRYVFKNPSIFSVELSEYILIFITFMSAAWVLKEDRHVNMTALVDHFPEKIRLFLDIITSLIVMVFCLVLIWKGSKTVFMAYSGDYHSSSLVNFPLWISYSIIPLGTLILFLQYMVRISNIIKTLTALRGK